MKPKTLHLILTLSVALLFSLIAFNNVSDYDTNYNFVKAVISMESVTSKDVMWRAITSPSLQHAIYISIIVWEALIAIICWIGLKSRRLAVTGMMMALTLFFVGFVVIAGEWFYMWDSPMGPMQSKAIIFSILFASFGFFLIRKEA